MEKVKRTQEPTVVVVENPALEAFRRYLKDGSDYTGIYRDYLMQSQKELSEAVQRRAAETLKRQKV